LITHVAEGFMLSEMICSTLRHSFLASASMHSVPSGYHSDQYTACSVGLVPHGATSSGIIAPVPAGPVIRQL